MGFTATILFYLLIGAGVSVAVFLSDDELTAIESLFRTSTAIVFWPLYLPALLNRPPVNVESAAASVEPVDGMTEFIQQVEAELDSALNSLDGWAEGVLAFEHDRFSELRAAWHLQAARIRELDGLLAQPEFLETATGASHESDEFATAEKQTTATEVGRRRERIRTSERARQENIDRLRAVRRQMNADLVGTLSWVRELVTMIHLAKFTGAPASRAEELVAQIAAAVEGLSEVSLWKDEPLVSAT